MNKKFEVNRQFVSQLAELIPEYQHESVSLLGNEIKDCLSTSINQFQVQLDLSRSCYIDIHNPKDLLRGYFHSLISIKIMPLK